MESIIQWFSGKFRAGGTLGGLGRSPQWGLGAAPLVGCQRGEASLKLKAFLISQGRGHFHLTSKFRKLCKPHIFQVTSD